MARAPPPSPVLVAAQERTIRHATSALFAIFAPSAASSDATANDRPSLSACLSCGARSPATIAQTLARSHLAGLGSQATWHWTPRVQVGVRRNAGPPAGPPLVAVFRFAGRSCRPAAPLAEVGRHARPLNARPPAAGPQAGVGRGPHDGRGIHLEKRMLQGLGRGQSRARVPHQQAQDEVDGRVALGQRADDFARRQLFIGGTSGWRFAKDPSYSHQRWRLAQPGHTSSGGPKKSMTACN